MLVLSRRSGESIIINDNIELKIVEIKGDYVKLGITAPRSIPVHRKEIYEAIQRENARAAETKKDDVKKLEEKVSGETGNEVKKKKVRKPKEEKSGTEGAGI